MLKAVIAYYSLAINDLNAEGGCHLTSVLVFFGLVESLIPLSEGEPI